MSSRPPKRKSTWQSSGRSAVISMVGILVFAGMTSQHAHANSILGDERIGFKLDQVSPEVLIWSTKGQEQQLPWRVASSPVGWCADDDGEVAVALEVHAASGQDGVMLATRTEATVLPLRAGLRAYPRGFQRADGQCAFVMVLADGAVVRAAPGEHDLKVAMTLGLSLFAQEEWPRGVMIYADAWRVGVGDEGGGVWWGRWTGELQHEDLPSPAMPEAVGGAGGLFLLQRDGTLRWFADDATKSVVVASASPSRTGISVHRGQIVWGDDLGSVHRFNGDVVTTERISRRPIVFPLVFSAAGDAWVVDDRGALFQGHIRTRLPEHPTAIAFSPRSRTMNLRLSGRVEQRLVMGGTDEGVDAAPAGERLEGATFSPGHAGQTALGAQRVEFGPPHTAQVPGRTDGTSRPNVMGCATGGTPLGGWLVWLVVVRRMRRRGGGYCPRLDP